MGLNIKEKFPGLDPHQLQMKQRAIQREQELYEAMAQYQMMVMAGVGGGGSASNVDPTANQYVENDYVEDYFV